ncbi:thioesterase family protein [Stenotrophomonas maltophilia]|uniref:thioesterase family protein n=1 Tax=Stenotrophomonas maltophilia TaxID=40324 RepID=UPI0009B25BA4|nr:thioesterase family protein [Stenotrophomonas maltophilia]
MNLWFRLLHLLLCSLFRPKLEAPFGVSRLQFRVLPNDLDSNLHMTNGRYWNIFDLGRLDLILRMGLAGWRCARNGHRSSVPAPSSSAASSNRFSASLWKRAWWGWVGSRGIMEQRVLIGAEQKIATRALLVTGIYDRRARQFLGMPKMMEAIGVVAPPSPPLSAGGRGTAGRRCGVEAGRRLSLREPPPASCAVRAIPPGCALPRAARIRRTAACGCTRHPPARRNWRPR